MSEEDEVFLERSFQRTLIVRLAPVHIFPTMPTFHLLPSVR